MRARAALARLALAVLLLAPAAALAEEKAQVFATNEAGYGRLILSFPGRLNLPEYRIRSDNGVLSVEFDDPIGFGLPDIAVTLPDYITIARIDPDQRGVRFGLRTAFNVHHMEAGERLFIDIMPTTWQGLPPPLPPDVVAELAERARQAALKAEQEQKAADAARLKPVAQVRVGRNPTFLRIQFDWNVPTKAEFVLDAAARLHFDWPVPVDLYPLKADLPTELTSAQNEVDANGSDVLIGLAAGVVPRFYRTSDTQFIVDVDIDPAEGQSPATALPAELVAAEAQKAGTAVSGIPSGAQPELEAATEQTEITPTIETTGGTVRITFPFDRDTPAAVFRRGDTVWMLFDTPTAIRPPAESEALSSIATGLAVVPTGDGQVVRLDLDVDRLATLGSEGRAWVLSIGDALLNPTEPLPLNRRRDMSGELEMVADLGKPFKVHRFRDPIVGDSLTVVTAYPPARGVTRSLGYVDFEALPSVHGLVLRPEHDGVDVALEGNGAVISTRGGLTLSSLEQGRAADSGIAPEKRATFIDLVTPLAPGTTEFSKTQEELTTRAAETEGAERDAARLDLARFYLANRFGEEAIGVLAVAQQDIRDPDLSRLAQLELGIANTIAHRPQAALAILNASSLSDESDATMWRTIARTQLGDFATARLDAMAAQSVIDEYPRWVREEFLFAGIRAALESNDVPLAQQLIARIEFAKLDPEAVTWFQLYSARIAEMSGRNEEALDGYGQVIAADVRPTRAEAIYRTLLLLDRTGRLDLEKATGTLAAEAMLWRGDRLELLMQQFLADLYFRHKDYRLGFETVSQTVKSFAESPVGIAMSEEAESVFSSLYLDGLADSLEPIDALSLYYDYRQLTPAGARGDEMIRNLARRLVKVDLLAQAADLLQYQVDNRLKGAAQAQVATELANIRLAARDPVGALSALSRTRLADLSPTLERQRRLLEARALIDSNRQDLALDLLHNLTGRDVDVMRIDGLWKSGQYKAASELIEVLYSPGDQGDMTSPDARMNIVKAAVGFVLADDQLGISRLRAKFGTRMAESQEWGLFDFVTSDVSPTSIEFRKVVREVSGLDSLNAFLAAYKQTYAAPGDPAPDKASDAGAAL